MVYVVPNYIDGEKVPGKGKAQVNIYNPAYGDIIGTLRFADVKTCDKAIKAAQKAFESWSQTPASKRAGILFEFRNLLKKHQTELAQIVCREHGKTIEDAKGSVARGIELVEFHCGLLSQVQQDFTAQVTADIDCFSLRQPLGVCAGVSPFNFPVMVPIWMMIPAIAAGNTFILKPSEQVPSAPVRLLELLSEAGLPPGVVNIVHGDKQMVDHLLAHEDIQAVTAVASTPVAEYIYQTAIAKGKRAHTFGGAKNHAVVMPDANLAQAAEAIVGAAFGSAGERCMAISVVVAVGDDTADQLLKHLVPLIKDIRIDVGESEHSDMGPLISQAHRQRVSAAIKAGVAEGAKLVVDGQSFVHPLHPQGFFLGPCLFDKVEESMSIYQQEIFGPVLVMLRVNTFEDALSLVKRNPYGNGTAIFTQSGFWAREYGQRVNVGMVGINIPIPVPIASHPFGGWKRSSFGDTAMHGGESLHFYTKVKTITSRWPKRDSKQKMFVMPTHT